MKNGKNKHHAVRLKKLMPPIQSGRLEEAQVTLTDCKFTINGKSYSLGQNIPPDTTLLRYIRDHAMLTGTKALCYEAGCGLCTVVATRHDYETNEHKTMSIRSCQTLVYACAGWSIMTIEHLGDRQVGYDRLQVALHGNYGTQCGYCTPGFIMSMKGATLISKELKVEQIEKLFDGNICRCTGYRPILDAFKSFGTDAPETLTIKLKDIEETYEAKCQKTGHKCGGNCDIAESCTRQAVTLDKNFILERNGVTWHYPKSISDIYHIMKQRKTARKIRFVVGNTGQGLFKNDGPYNVYVNTTGVKLLYDIASRNFLSIGSNVSLNRCIELFHSTSKQKGYHHLSEVAKHWEVVANVGVRNTGSWAGNLRMKHDHNDFASDIFITLVAIDAQLKIGRCDGEVTEIPVEEFLAFDMRRSFILSLKIPPQKDNVVLRTYKITPRAVNAHAYVNGCFRFQLESKDEPRVISRPAIVLGGINPTFIRAAKTEKFLIGKLLSDSEDLNKAIQMLGDELSPTFHHADALPEFRKVLSQCLLYKTVLNILGDSVSSNLQSGGAKLVRPVSSSKQTYDANEDSWPIGQPVEKLESQIQISGEAEFLDDFPPLPGELYGAFVQSKIGKGKIKSINTTDCLKMKGVVDFITAKDIPGRNTFFAASYAGEEPIFADVNIIYNGQAIGLVVAESRTIAQAAAKLVKVAYEDVKKPVLTIKDSIKENKVEKNINYFTMNSDPITFGDVEEGFKNSKHVIEGEISFGSQFHFSMEPISGRVVPIEDGYDVWCTTQWPTETQNAVAANLGLPANSINISTRRIGGGFGSKITRANITASAAAIAAHKHNKPVRVALDLTTNMTLVGWREPFYFKYKVGFDEEGILQAIEADVYADVGHVINESSSFIGAFGLPSMYYCPNLKLQPYNAITDLPSNTWCRTPGNVEAVGAIETIIERIAHTVQKDSLVVRELNFTSQEKPHFFNPRKIDNSLQTRILPLLKAQADIEKRRIEVDKFNNENRWRKRGLSVIPMCFKFDSFPSMQFNCHVVIYEYDGSVDIKHGGIEMGQGINTKVAQVAAKILGVPLDMIKVKATDSFTGVNSSFTGATLGSDLNAHGVKICCERLRERMDKVAETITSENGPPDWTSLVKKCFAEQVDISERYYTIGKEHPKGYDIWGVCCTEVELDVLTGQFLILRSDIIEDCGRSMSPYVDVGQVEGAFVMGLGFFTCEQVKYDPNTGERLSNSTWEYKLPTALDIPIDFRVSFLPKGDNEFGVVRSKATGEPPLCLSYSVVTAMRQAISSKRVDDGKTEWFDMDVPLTVEKIHELCDINPTQLKL